MVEAHSTGSRIWCRVQTPSKAQRRAREGSGLRKAGNQGRLKILGKEKPTLAKRAAVSEGGCQDQGMGWRLTKSPRA